MSDGSSESGKATRVAAIQTQDEEGEFDSDAFSSSAEKESEATSQDAEQDISFIKEDGEGDSHDVAQEETTKEDGEKNGRQEEIQHEDTAIGHSMATNKADDRIRRKIQRMERRNHQQSPLRTKSASVSSAVTARTSSTSTDVGAQHPRANCEPGGGLALAAVTRTEPEPAFKAAPAPSREPPQVGAVFCAHRPSPQQSLGGSQTRLSSGKSVWSAALTSNNSRSTPNIHIDGTPIDTEWFKGSSLQQQQQQDQVDVTNSSTGHDSIQPISGISAEIVPETQLDLERAISDRVRRDLFLSASLRQDILKDTPMAVVVQESMHSVQSPERIEEDEPEATLRASTQSDICDILRGNEKQSQWMIGLLVLVILVVVIVMIVVITLAATGAFSSSNDISAATNDTFRVTPGGSSLYEDDFVLATVPETICYDRLPYMGYSDVGVIPLCLPQSLGSPVTNLLQQSRLWNFPEAEIAIGSAGEVKRDIMPGNFTYANLKTFMPYDDPLVFVTLQGSQIVSLLERVLQTIVNDLTLSSLNYEDHLDGAYPYAAGLRYHVNMSEAFPQRISNVEVNQRSNESWGNLNLTAQYTIVTSTYLKNGGDGYHELSAVTSQGTGVSSRAAFIEYCLDQNILLDPPRDSFSTQSFYFVPGMYDSWNL